MDIRKNISLALALLPLGAMAQSNGTTLCDFETAESYKSVGVYDTWEQSPFRTGKLTGNAKVVKNHLTGIDALLGYAPNTSNRILAVQRSRFGSNTFGALVGLKTPFALTKTTQYVHVKINSPKGGKVMLIALGNRDDRQWQPALTEQCWSQCTSKISADRWCDAVFPISGSDGITIRNLLVVVDATSPHDMAEDFAAYIDDIILSNDPLPFFSSNPYTINYDEQTTLSRSDRYTSAVSLTNGDGVQSVETGQQTSKKLYVKRMDNCFLAKPGEKVTPKVTFSGSWMAGYAYIDKGNDGAFNVGYDDSGVTDMGDLMSFALYKGEDSDGNTVSASPSSNPPAFTIPSDMKPGIYRMRYKVDWDCVDPGGNTSSTNKISDNGGIIVDTRINIHNTTVSLFRAVDGLGGGLNGDILLGDGSAVTDKKVPFGKDLKVRVKPAPGFRFSHLVIRHGYNIDGDSLVNENRQWEEVTVRASQFSDNEYTIPAKLVDGDMRFVPYFSSDSGGGETKGDYALNFDEGLETKYSETSKLSFFELTTSSGEKAALVVDQNGKSIYQDITPQTVYCKAGDSVTASIGYTGNALMNAYLYIDTNQDGSFFAQTGSDGKPGTDSELLAYSFFDGHNSLGQATTAAEAGCTLPQFTIPEGTAPGTYRARLKLDTDNIDPAGKYSEGQTDGIDCTGGRIVDFLVNVHGDTGTLTADGIGGHIVGAFNTGIGTEATYRTSLSVLPLAPCEGYRLEKLTVRHGHNLKGEQYIHGNRQWNEYEAADAEEGIELAIPKDSIDGDVLLTAVFAPDGSEEYKLRYADEFNLPDGSMPDASCWSRCSRENPTWKRFTAQTAEGQAATAFTRDGMLVTRCIANSNDDEGQVEMISGAIESAGKLSFTYGRVEGRLKTNPHTGNFPAFWMMPQDGSAGWPNAGEIDIWEQIDTENVSYHTVHTHATYDLKLALPNSGNLPTTADEFHVIALEWTPTLLTWYVDGNKAFSYAKSSQQDLLDKGQWPFDKPFYLILNQSVGNGSWAKPCDVNYEYETLFDYVRIYQKDGQDITLPSAIDETQCSGRLDVYSRHGGLLLVSPEARPVRIADTLGRTVFSGTVQGNKTVSLAKGIYIVEGKKVMAI